jgi:sec-independent protein translocase protein TatA
VDVAVRRERIETPDRLRKARPMMSNLAIWTPGPGELVLILAALFLIFGAKKLPELARSMGSSINEFKRGLKDAPGAKPGDEQRKDPEPDDETR